METALTIRPIFNEQALILYIFSVKFQLLILKIISSPLVGSTNRQQKIELQLNKALKLLTNYKALILLTASKHIN